MSRAARELPALRIRRSVYERLIMYGLSRHEFGAILLGRANVVTEVRRIRNVDPWKKDYFEWDKKQRVAEVKSARGRGLSLLAECHSHPGADHLERPSSLDRKYFCNSIPHLIVRSSEGAIYGWDLKSMDRVRLILV